MDKKVSLDWLSDPEVFAVNRLPVHRQYCLSAEKPIRFSFTVRKA
jgi:hypothetical protein